MLPFGRIWGKGMHERDGVAELSVETCRTMRFPSTAAQGSHADRSRLELLSGLVEAEVLPRLLDAHQAQHRGADNPVAPRAADPDGLVALLRQGRVAEACGQIEARLQSGATPQTVMIEDLGPAARKLGALWDRDECDFVDVSLGLGALHGLLRELTPSESPVAVGAPSILILLTPGETHEFGAKIAERFFISAGWRTDRSDASQFRAALAREWFHAVGFSLSCERYGESLEHAIAAARAASRNPQIKVVVGGAIFSEKPSLAKKLGADLYAANAETTVNLSRILLREFEC